ncbi:MAG: metal-sulfur cluster assembly factor [Planctomycetaceae bacterium]|nr:metal-sulfur cluster assembly factor [Planctomycetaceae bacterium]
MSDENTVHNPQSVTPAEAESANVPEARGQNLPSPESPPSAASAGQTDTSPSSALPIIDHSQTETHSCTPPDLPAATDEHGNLVSTDADYIEALRQVIDPELMVNIIDLGLIYSVAQNGENPRHVRVEMTLTSPSCPAGPQLVQQSRMALERLHDVDQAEIVLVMSPPWTPERMTDDARDQLGIF